jgi:hypothetical protein
VWALKQDVFLLAGSQNDLYLSLVGVNRREHLAHVIEYETPPSLNNPSIADFLFAAEAAATLSVCTGRLETLAKARVLPGPESPIQHGSYLRIDDTGRRPPNYCNRSAPQGAQQQ